MTLSPRCNCLSFHARSGLRTLGLLALVLVVTGAFEARAQGGVGPPSGTYDFVVIPALVLEAMTQAAGVVTGAGMTYDLTQGRLQRGWVVSSYVTATLNAGMAGLYLYGAFELANSTGGDQGAAILAALACLHLGNALWNVIAASMGLASQPPDGGPTVTPVVLTGRSPGGALWSGLAIQVANF